MKLIDDPGMLILGYRIGKYLYTQYAILYSKKAILRRKPLNPPSIQRLPTLPILSMYPHIPKSIMQPTLPPLPKLHTLRHQPHTTPKRRQRYLLHTLEPLPHLIHPLLKHSTPVGDIHLVHIRRDLRFLDETLPPVFEEGIWFRRPEYFTLPTRPRTNLALPFACPPVHFALLASKPLQ